MRKFLLLLVTVGILVSPGWMLQGWPSRNPEVKALKDQQKREMKALNQREKLVKQSYKGRNVPAAVRDQQLHQLEHEKREMKERHRMQLQQLKDRQKAMRANAKAIGLRY